ncbi:hypothetical protein BT93_E2177 [Corymbia citriodora subsp. variegata]|nr:hypothetical protein BT93_E2177 [Corymbia citriodora subsp. variegata]
MAKIEFSTNPTHLPKRPQPRPPPDSYQDEPRNSVDYISQLPDAIILLIFSFLTTKDTIKTSVLSKRWRSTWTANPRIFFSMPSCHNSRMFQSFMTFVDAVLLRCTAIKVNSFLFDAPFTALLESNFLAWRLSADALNVLHNETIRYNEMTRHNKITRYRLAPSFRCVYLRSCEEVWLNSAVGPTIDKWLCYATGHNVEEVLINLLGWRHNIYVLPQFFFCCTTLVSIHVSHCCFPMIGVVYWSSLKRLHIEDAELKDDTLMSILNGSPVLEFLELKHCLGFKHIESRALRELVINSHRFHHGQELVINSHRFHHGQESILKISAPHLLKLHLLGLIQGRDGEFILDELPSLVEAELTFNIEIFELDKVKVYGDLVKGLLERVHRVRRLGIGSWCLQVSGVFLPSLECRHLMFHVTADYEGVPGIAKILESSPCLEKLLLQMTCTPSSVTVGHHNFDVEELWISAKQRIYQCLMHVKNVEIIDPGANWLAWEPVLSVLKSLLQNAPRLDKIEINSNNSKLSKAIDPWVLLEVVQIILLHSTHSPNLKVILSYPSQGCPLKARVSWSSD